jgi:hypothetical protein
MEHWKKYIKIFRFSQNQILHKKESISYSAQICIFISNKNNNNTKSGGKKKANNAHKKLYNFCVKKNPCFFVVFK